MNRGEGKRSKQLSCCIGKSRRSKSVVGERVRSNGWRKKKRAAALWSRLMSGAATSKSAESMKSESAAGKTSSGVASKSSDGSSRKNMAAQMKCGASCQRKKISCGMRLRPPSCGDSRRRNTSEIASAIGLPAAE